MREIEAKEITKAIADMVIEANKKLPITLENRIHKAPEKETNPLAKMALTALSDNLYAAQELDIPICQDTGMAVVFADVGQDVHIVGGDFQQAIQEGVREGYINGLLRLSIVNDPLKRKNTKDNTPAVIHTNIVPGNQIHLHVAPKGFGSENMSQLKMMMPSATKEDIMAFILKVVKEAGSNACPPMVIGVGIGGNFESCTLLAKRALSRDINIRHSDGFYKQMEEELLVRINDLGIGAQGFGGNTTAFAINIETAPTHIAGLPVAVNIGCHATRSVATTL